MTEINHTDLRFIVDSWLREVDSAEQLQRQAFIDLQKPEPAPSRKRKRKLNTSPERKPLLPTSQNPTKLPPPTSTLAKRNKRKPDPAGRQPPPPSTHARPNKRRPRAAKPQPALTSTPPNPNKRKSRLAEAQPPPTSTPPVPNERRRYAPEADTAARAIPTRKTTRKREEKMAEHNSGDQRNTGGRELRNAPKKSEKARELQEEVPSSPGPFSPTKQVPPSRGRPTQREQGVLPRPTLSDRARLVPTQFEMNVQAPPSAPSTIAEGVESGDFSRTPSSTKEKGKAKQKKDGSPVKTEKSFENTKAEASLTPEDLASCNPSVRLSSLREVFDQLGKPPPRVDELRLQMNDRAGYIPRALQPRYEQAYNTPNKSRQVLFDHHFQDTYANTVERAEILDETVQYVTNNGGWSVQKDAHERHWGTTTINPIFTAAAMKWQSQGAWLCNLESCVIMPHSIRMRRKGGAPIDMGDQATDSSNSRATTANTVEAKSARMVDYGFGLKLEHKLMKTITDAFKEFYDYQKSLNQSMSFIKSVPFFLDIEVKKKHQVRTPEVQLAIWAAALYKKRQHHGWDVQIPMPGICINGHVWEFYIIFETGEDELCMMGPFPMGSTASVPGSWHIMFKLDILMQWGTKEYKRYFTKDIIVWVERVKASLIGRT